LWEIRQYGLLLNGPGDCVISNSFTEATVHCVAFGARRNALIVFARRATDGLTRTLLRGVAES
jgi:hypothetical protein